MDCLYALKEEVIETDEKRARAFGVEVYDSEGELLARLPSLFFSRERAEGFVSLCNRLALSPSHLFEVADDILAE